MKKILSLFLAVVFLISNTASALAHVSVSPGEAETESYQTFVVNAPTHGETSVVGIRIVIPEGVTNVTPTVKNGWNVTVVRDGQHAMPDGTIMDDNAHAAGEHDNASHGGTPVRELIWTGGIIPGEQRDEFSFSAKTPENSTTLYWKAYQTFSDGKVVSWELGPNDSYPKTESGEDDVENYGPASETLIVTADSSEQEEIEQQSFVENAQRKSDNSLILSVIAIILAGGAFGMQFVNKKKK